MTARTALREAFHDLGHELSHVVRWTAIALMWRTASHVGRVHPATATRLDLRAVALEESAYRFEATR